MECFYLFITWLNDILCFFYLHKLLVRKTFCRNNEFLCSNGEQCIPQGWVCDRHRDCGDNSDEKSCGKGFNKTEATDSIHDSLPPRPEHSSSSVENVSNQNVRKVDWNPFSSTNLIKFSSRHKRKFILFRPSIICFLSEAHKYKIQSKARIQQVFNQFPSAKHFAYIFPLSCWKRSNYSQFTLKVK